MTSGGAEGKGKTEEDKVDIQSLMREVINSNSYEGLRLMELDIEDEYLLNELNLFKRDYQKFINIFLEESFF